MLQQFNQKNKDIKIYVNGEILHRDEAKISVFDSVVQGGDAVWEGLRVYDHQVFCLDRHLDRLFRSAHAMMFRDVPSREEIKKAVFDTLKANEMYDGVHARLTLTRGEKITSGMDPRLNQKGLGLIIVPEWKPPVYDNDHGITVFTSAIRRNNPQFLDSKIHHANLINNILAKIQANEAGADAALMLDERGFASELNGTNVFIIQNGALKTPLACNCLPGITRNLLLEICQEEQWKHHEAYLSLTELYTADFAFATGTMGELTPISAIDGRKIIETASAKKFFLEIEQKFVDKRKVLSEKIQ